jgi:hypothetical protein
MIQFMVARTPFWCFVKILYNKISLNCVATPAQQPCSSFDAEATSFDAEAKIDSMHARRDIWNLPSQF